MGDRNDSKSTISEAEVNFSGKPCPGRLCPMEQPRLNPGYKIGASTEETVTQMLYLCN